MNTANNVKYYIMRKALVFLLESRVITREEYEDTCGYIAEILHPDPEFIR